MADNLPALPPGFQLDDEPAPLEIEIKGGRPPASVEIPPLPEGFELDTDQAVPGSAGNANDSDFARMITGAPRQDSSIGRDLGMSARSVIQGAGGLIGSIGGDAVNRYLVPGDQPTYREAASSLADSIGLPKPETSRERVLGDVGEALTGTGLTLGIGGAAGATSRLGQFLTANPGLQAVSSAAGSGASSAVRESGGGAGAQLAAGLAGGLAPAAVTAGIPAAVRGAIRGGETGRQRVAENIANFQAAGTMPTVGQATESPVYRGIEQTLARTPGSSSVVTGAAQRQAQQIGQGVEDLAAQLSTASSAGRAGEAIVNGIKGPGGFVERGKDIASRLYDRVDNYIPADQPVALTNAQSTLQKLTRPNPDAPQTTGLLVNNRLASIDKALGDDLQAAAANGANGLPYQVVKDLRSRVGNMLVGNELLSDIPKAEIKQVYAALSRDLEDAAKAAGPEATRAAQQASNFYKWFSNRSEQLEKVINKNGGPEKVYSAIEATTRDGDTTLRTVMNSLPRDAQKELAAAFVRRMGRAVNSAQNDTGDVFSTQTFLSNWNKASPEAKQLIFSRFGPNYAGAMDKIAKVASNLRDGSQVFANPSGTSGAAAQIAGLTSFVTSVVTGNLGVAAGIGGGAATTNLWARALTNPRFVTWLATQGNKPIGAIPAQAETLRQIAERNDEPELADAANAIEQAYEDQTATRQ